MPRDMSHTLHVEVVSAELAPDGGPAPDVRCTLVQRDLEGIPTSADLRSAVCKRSWNPVWKETLTVTLQRRENTEVACTLWDESQKGSEPACLGESAFQLNEFVFFGQGPAVVRGFALHQGRDADRRVVGTIFLRIRHAGAPDSPRSIGSQRGVDHRSRKMDADPRNRKLEVPDSPRTIDTRAERANPSPFAPQYPTTGSDQFRTSPRATQTFDSPRSQRRDRYANESHRDVVPTNGRPSEMPRVSYSDETFEMQRVAQKREQAAAEKLTTTVLLVRSPPLGYVSDIPGEHVGVGLGLQRGDDGHFFVSSVVPETPAAHASGAGMLSIGDVVESIDGMEVRYRSVDEVIRTMKGPMNSHVTLEVRKSGSGYHEWSHYAPAQDQTVYDVPVQRTSVEPTADIGNHESASFSRTQHSAPASNWPRRDSGQADAVSRHSGAPAVGDFPAPAPAMSSSQPFSSAMPIEMHRGSTATPGHWMDQTTDGFPVQSRTGRQDPSLLESSHRWPSVSPYTRPTSTVDQQPTLTSVRPARYGSIPSYNQVLDGAEPAVSGALVSQPKSFGPDPTPRKSPLQPEEGLTVLVFTIDEDFSAAAARQEDFWAVLCFDLATAVSASSKRFNPLGMQEGSIIAAVEIVQEFGGGDGRPSSALGSLILSHHKNPASPLRQTPSMQYCRSIHLLPHRPAWASASTTPAGDVEEGVAQKTALQMAMHRHRMMSRSSLDREPELGSVGPTLRPTAMSAAVEDKMEISSGPRDVAVSLQAGFSATELRGKTSRAGHSFQHADPDRTEHSSVAQHQSADTTGDTPPADGPEGGNADGGVGQKARSLSPSSAELLDLRKLYFRLAALLVGTIAIGFILGSRSTAVPWHWLAWVSLLVLGIAPWSVSPLQFFSGSGASLQAWAQSVQTWRLPPWTSGFSMLWIATSTFLSAQEGSLAYRAAEYGHVYGSLGGFGMAIYFVGVSAVGGLIYKIRLRHPHATGMIGLVNVCFGPGAAGAFGAIVMYRLLGLVWAAASTAGRLFVATDPETGLFAAGLLCGLGPIVYCVMGGLRAQVTTHPLLALTTAIGLLIALVSIPAKPCWICGTSSPWRINEGADLILLRLFHGVFALPWCTATLTDRMFLSDPKTSVIGFSLGMFLAWLYTFTSSFIGIYAKHKGNLTPSVAGSYRLLGDEYYHLFLVNTLASAIGGIDACFVSASKLGGLELYGLLMHRTGAATAQPMRAMSSALTKNNLLAGRISVLALGLVGLCALAREVSRPGSLEQASLTGTMALGLFPPMVLVSAWDAAWKRSPLAFVLPVLVSLVIGVTQSARSTCVALLDGACVNWRQEFASGWAMGDGPNNVNLGLSVYTTLLCTLASIVGFAVDQQFRLPDEADGEVNLVLRDAEHAMDGDSFFAGGFGIRPVPTPPSEDKSASMPRMVAGAEA